jgi:threonine dehydrogenase-like Zn-dependent dehydrogenase
MTHMQALFYNGPGKKALGDRAKPTVQTPSDAVVRITKTTICGTDLHILKCDVPTCLPGTVLGHEGVGIIDEVGAGMTTFKPGDRVLISCISACGVANLGLYKVSQLFQIGQVVGESYRSHRPVLYETASLGSNGWPVCLPPHKARRQSATKQCTEAGCRH